MKCLRRSLQFNFLLTLVVTVLFASCHQQTVEKFFSDKSFSQKETGGLAVTVVNFVGGSQRTIAPNQLTSTELQDAAQYRFKLTGTSGRKTLPERDVVLTNGTTVLSNIPEGLWALTLRATSVVGGNGVVQGESVLEGNALAQVSGTGVASASFTLVPPKTGEGQLLLNIVINQQDRVALTDSRLRKRLVIELFNKNGTREVYSNYNQRGTGTFSQYRFPHNGAKNTFSAGLYELRVTISMGIKASPNNSNPFDPLPEANVLTWQDEVYIEPGRLTESTIDLPQLINRAPPVTLGTPNGYTVEEYGLFDVDLNWTPVAYNYNTKGYELELLNIGNSMNPVTNDGAWDSNTGAKYKIDNIPGSTNHFTAKLNSYPVSVRNGMSDFTLNTSKLSLTLAAGRYAYRMRTLSDTGNSNWSYGTTVLMPKPKAPGLPNTYFGGLVNPWRNDPNKFRRNIEWIRDPYATSYQVQLIVNGSKPSGTIDQYQTDQYWDSVGKHTFSYGGSSGNLITGTNSWVLVRVRSVNASGNSSWTYYPHYFTFNGPQL